jgi:hypothetical protein
MSNNEWVPLSSAEMCELSHGGPSCLTEEQFRRRHWAYMQGLGRGLKQYDGVEIG